MGSTSVGDLRKSVRLILERYSQYLTSRGHVPAHRRSYVRVVEHFGRWLGRRQISKSHVQQFLDQGLTNCHCPGVSRHLRRNRAALHHLLEMLGLGRQASHSSARWHGQCTQALPSTPRQGTRTCTGHRLASLDVQPCNVGPFRCSARVPTQGLDARNDRTVCGGSSTWRSVERPKCWVVCSLFLAVSCCKRA